MHAISLWFAFGGIRSAVPKRKNLAGRGNVLKRHQRNVVPLPDDFISAAYRTRIELKPPWKLVVAQWSRT